MKMTLDTRRIRKKGVKDSLASSFARILSDLNRGPEVATSNSERAEPIIVAGNLTKLTANPSEWSVQSQRRPMGVLGVIEADEDDRAMMFVDMLSRASEGRFWVIQAKTNAVLKALNKAELFAKIIGTFAPTYAVFAACFSPDRIFVRFGDGLAGEIPFAKIGLSAAGLRLNTLRASPEGDSVEVQAKSGKKIVDVDSSALRSFLDQRHAKDLRAKNEEIRMVVGRRIRTEREANGVSQLDLAAKTGIAQEAISRIEHGKQEPRYGTLLKLANGLGTTIGKLLES